MEEMNNYNKNQTLQRMNALLIKFFGCYLPFRTKYKSIGAIVLNIIYATSAALSVLLLVYFRKYGEAFLCFLGFWAGGVIVIIGPKTLSDVIKEISQSLGGRPKCDQFPTIDSPFQTKECEEQIRQIMVDAGRPLKTEDAVAIAQILTSSPHFLNGKYRRGDMAWWLYQQNLKLFQNQEAKEPTLKTNSPGTFVVKAWGDVMTDFLNPPVQ